MTSYSVERPTRQRPGDSRVRPGLVHLRPGQATTGQPVTIRTLDEHGSEVEFPAVYVRADGVHMRCVPDHEGNARRFRPSQVFPRRVAYRRWTVTLRHKAIAPDGGRDELYPVSVVARTELEARAQTLREIKHKFGEDAAGRFAFHSAKRED